MKDDVEDFFSELAEQGHVAMLAATTGTVRFDLVDGDRTDHWRVAITRGRVDVEHRGGPADCGVRADRVWFERLLRGEENAIAAVLRGALDIEGDVEVLFAVQRIFPGPAGRVPQGEGSVWR